jgi:hypothetical protein
MFINRRWQIGMIFFLCTVYVVQGMEPSIVEKINIKKELDTLACIKPRNIVEYLSKIEPQKTQLAIFDQLTGYDISGLYETLTKDLPLAKIGEDLETEARKYGCLYLPDKENSIVADNTPPYNCIYQSIASRFVLTKETEVCMELYSWDPSVQLWYLENIDGVTIPVDRKRLNCYKMQCNPLDQNGYMAHSKLPGKIHVLKKIDFQLNREQKTEGYLASQTILIDPYFKDLPLFTIDATIDDVLRRVSIYTRTNIHPDFCSRYIYSYELATPCASGCFTESLCQFIAHEIKKINVLRVAELKSLYEKLRVPPHIITTLYILASNDLSYRHNEELHSLLASSEEFGSIQLIPEEHRAKVCFWPNEAKKVAKIWGFRTKERIKEINEEKITRAKIASVRCASGIYLKCGVPDSVINKLYILANSKFPYEQHQRLHSLLMLSEKFGTMQAFPEECIPEIFSWPSEVQALLHTWGFRTSEEMMNSST